MFVRPYADFEHSNAADRADQSNSSHHQKPGCRQHFLVHVVAFEASEPEPVQAAVLSTISLQKQARLIRTEEHRINELMEPIFVLR